MKIATNIKGRAIPAYQTQGAEVVGRICRALDGFPEAADRATVTVEDRGGHVTQCRIQLWVEGVLVMVVQVEDADPVTCVDRAVDRLRLNLTRQRRSAPRLSDRPVSTR